ncbi:MAG TPA: NifU family protein [Acholeplasmataceae bacterium]|jgi:Fe-S cluster biogenesis protein NfuA|nr:NifU family protein [Acholeplasmataceae bacterium]
MNHQETEKRIKNIINRIRPYLQHDGGDCEFVKFEDGVVYIRMKGACVGCASIDLTLKDGIEAILLEDVPGVIAVETVD